MRGVIDDALVEIGCCFEGRDMRVSGVESMRVVALMDRLSAPRLFVIVDYTI